MGYHTQGGTSEVLAQVLNFVDGITLGKAGQLKTVKVALGKSSSVTVPMVNWVASAFFLTLADGVGN